MQEKSNQVGGESSHEGKAGTPLGRAGASRKAVNKYVKLEARPLRRSSISAARKSDKGTRRLFLHKKSPAEGKVKKKKAASENVLSPELPASPPPVPPPKPPRAHQVKNIAEQPQSPEQTGKSGKGKRRRNSKRARYPESMAFSDTFLITKVSSISIDDDVNPSERGDTTEDLRACLGETTPRRVGLQSSVTRKRRSADPKKHWSAYYRAAMNSDDSAGEESKRPLSQPEPLKESELPPSEPPADSQNGLPTLYEDRELSPTSPNKKPKWQIFAVHHKKDKKSREEKKRLKEEQKREKKEKKRLKKEKKSKGKEYRDGAESPEVILCETDETKSPDVSDAGKQDNFYESSEDEDCPEWQRLARNREKRFQLAENEREARRQKKNQQFYIKLEMRERERKRLRIAQSIQRELVECEVRQQELETRAVVVEKKMASVEAGNPNVEQKLMLEWFDLVNRKNTLVRYESELVIRSTSIELEDKQQHLELQIRELMMKDVSTEEDQTMIGLLTRELVDIVDQRNSLVELLDNDRKREIEEDMQFETMMASKV